MGRFSSHAFEVALRTGNLREYAADALGRFLADLNMWQRIPAFRQFVFESPAARIAASIMGRRESILLRPNAVKESERLSGLLGTKISPTGSIRTTSMFRLIQIPSRKSVSEFVRKPQPAHNPHHFGDDASYEARTSELPNIESEIEEYEILSYMVPGDCLVFKE